MLAAWEGVKILSVDTDVSVASLGAERSVEANVVLGSVSAGDIEVQLVHGPVGQHDELEQSTITTMTPAGEGASGSLRFRGSFSCSRAGRYGFTVRVVPAHPDLTTSIELGRVAWAGVTRQD